MKTFKFSSTNILWPGPEYLCVRVHGTLTLNENGSVVDYNIHASEDIPAYKYKAHQRIKSPWKEKIVRILHNQILQWHPEYKAFLEEIANERKNKLEIARKERLMNQREEESALENVKKGDREALLKYLRLCSGGEIGHCEADNALLTFIGDEEITNAFHSIRRWYA